MHFFCASMSLTKYCLALRIFFLYSAIIFSFYFFTSSSGRYLHWPSSILNFSTTSFTYFPTFIRYCSSSSYSWMRSYNFSRLISWFVFLASSSALWPASSTYFMNSIIPFSTSFSKVMTFFLILYFCCYIIFGGQSSLFLISAYRLYSFVNIFMNFLSYWKILLNW